MRPSTYHSRTVPGFLSDPALPTVAAVVLAMLALAFTFR
jgi:hypothetical protein